MKLGPGRQKQSVRLRKDPSGDFSVSGNSPTRTVCKNEVPYPFHAAIFPISKTVEIVVDGKMVKIYDEKVRIETDVRVLSISRA